MIQKYSISIDSQSNKLVIREYGELNKDVLSLLCEETYDYTVMETAVGEGKQALISALRTPNLFPPHSYISAIADAVMDVYRSPGGEAVELSFNDIDIFSQEDTTAVVEISEEDNPEKDAADIDDLLEDGDNDFDDGIEIQKNLASIKIADDSADELEEDG